MIQRVWTYREHGRRGMAQWAEETSQENWKNQNKKSSQCSSSSSMRLTLEQKPHHPNWVFAWLWKRAPFTLSTSHRTYKCGCIWSKVKRLSYKITKPLIVSVSCLSQSDRESKRFTLRNRDTWSLLGNEYGVCVSVMTVSFVSGTQWIKEKMGMRFFFSCFCSIICTFFFFEII